MTSLRVGPPVRRENRFLFGNAADWGLHFAGCRCRRTCPLRRSRSTASSPVPHSPCSNAGRLRSRVRARVRHMIERMSEEIPELGVDERLTPLLNASVESNVETVLHLLQHGMVLDGFETPWAAGEYARRLAQHDVPLVALIR